jgi:hypothetical protein
VNILPFDLTEIISTELQRQRRPHDDLLHASSHITAPLRHVQLDVAGAPRVPNELIREFPLWIGQMMHEWIHDTLRKLGVPYMAEVNLTPWLPISWGGTADALVYNPEFKAFVLTDFKTQKGEGMRYIVRDGAKVEHKAQTSAYWYAAKKMGLPLAKVIGVYYLPKNDTRSKDELIEPVLMDFEPLPVKELHATMRARAKGVASYVSSLPKPNPRPLAVKDYLTDELAPVADRVQKLYFDRKTETWDVKLVPHWTSMFCEFPNELCNCSEQSTTKIGMYDIDGETYIPRTGYEDIEPEVSP